MADDSTELTAGQLLEQLITEQAFTGVPEFYDIPDALAHQLEKETIRRERLFWMRASKIVKHPATVNLLRRALYAEVRCWEMENRAAEMALIVDGATGRIRELEAQLTGLASDTGQTVPQNDLRDKAIEQSSQRIAPDMDDTPDA